MSPSPKKLKKPNPTKLCSKTPLPAVFFLVVSWFWGDDSVLVSCSLLLSCAGGLEWPEGDCWYGTIDLVWVVVCLQQSDNVSRRSGWEGVEKRGDGGLVVIVGGGRYR